MPCDLQIGDVIKSPLFAFGWKEPEQDAIFVDGKTKRYPVHIFQNEEDRVAEAARTGKIPPKERVEERGAYDESRGEAEFVVTRAVLEGGGMAMANDRYPDGWHITASRLGTDGRYNVGGELIRFFLTGCFTYQIDIKDIQLVRRVELVVSQKLT